MPALGALRPERCYKMDLVGLRPIDRTKMIPLVTYLLDNYKPEYQDALDLVFLKTVLLPLQRAWFRRRLMECGCIDYRSD